MKVNFSLNLPVFRRLQRFWRKPGRGASAAPGAATAGVLADDVVSPPEPQRHARPDPEVAASPSHDSIEVHVASVQNLFDSLDPAPFRERDLDPKVEQYIVGWARELPPRRPLELVVHLGHPADGDADLLQRAVRDYFEQRAAAERRALRHMLHIGRVSLAIGLGVLAAAMVLGDLLSGFVGRYAYGEIIAHSLLIGGWVALWRPLEIFLYDWWPIRANAKLYDRLSAMPVRVVDAPAPPPGAAPRRVD